MGTHVRLVMAAVLLIALTTLILDIVGVQIMRRFMVKRFEDRVTFLAKYLALNSEVGVLIGDRAGLKSLAMNLLGEEDVARVVIADGRQEPQVDISREVAGRLSLVETPVVFKKMGEENLLFTPQRTNPFQRESPAVTETIGSVRIYFSTDGIHRLIGVITRQFVWVSLGLVFVAGAVFYFISRNIVRDIRRLVDTAREVGKGDYDLRASGGALPETAELALAFNTMLDSLEGSRRALARAQQEMVRQKSLAEMGKFSLMIAHEVKNPLGIIKSSLDILKNDLGLTDANTMVAYMEDEVRRLNHLIEEFLSFARPARPALREVDMNELAKDIVERFEIQQSDLEVRFETEVPGEPFWIRADRDLVARSIGNIIKNACEANENKGVVFVRASFSDEWWALEVEDGGPGIPAENVRKIFDPFFTTRSRGTGLGLAFVSHVVEAHGGNVSAENVSDGGARFRIELPRTMVGD
jgi:signal transduction histidine kinase